MEPGDIQVWSRPEDPRLGDYVRTKRLHFEGRVTDKYYSCPESKTWFNGQHGLEPSDFTSVHWVEILVNGGGGIVVPVADCEVVEPFPFTHRDVDMYFREDEFTTWPKLARERVYNLEGT